MKTVAVMMMLSGAPAQKVETPKPQQTHEIKQWQEQVQRDKQQRIEYLEQQFAQKNSK